jgi:hypothetical protein
MIGSCWYQFLKDFAGPIATVIASVTAAIVALRMGRTQADISKSQLRTAHEKLRLDLFEKRYAVYTAARDLISVILRDGDLNDADLRKFYIGTADASFLFHHEVVAYLSRLKNRSTLICLNQNERKRLQKLDLVPPDELTQNNLMDLLTSFSDDSTKLDEYFRPYLGFDEKNVI